ncbi:MAG TPA: hypothetical protein VIV60_13815 [Polyangiaceae bacterium]
MTAWATRVHPMGWAVGIVVSIVVSGCGGKSDDSGPRTESTTGGTNSVDSRTSAKGGRSATTGKLGGASNTLATSSATGGTGYIGVGGSAFGSAAASTGGSTHIGGSTSIGGSASIGGSNTMGGVRSESDGGSSTSIRPIGGGAGLTSINDAGGSTAGGSGSHQSGASAYGGRSAVPNGGFSFTAGNGSGAVAGTLVDFCTGDASRVKYDGMLPSPAAATTYESSVAMDCCMAYGVNWHTEASLGFDLALDLIMPVSIDRKPGDYVVGGDSGARNLRAQLFRSNDTQTWCTAHGIARVLNQGTTGIPYELGLCLEVDATSTGCVSSTLYVPRLSLTNYAADKRYQIFLLADPTLTTMGVQSTPLDDLTLADQPWIHLGQIAYVEASTGRVGFPPGTPYGQGLRLGLSKLSANMHRPFVVVADGVRIYLGTFQSIASSSRVPGPIIIPESIGDQSFVIEAPNPLPDPRLDARIQTVLEQTSRLVP